MDAASALAGRLASHEEMFGRNTEARKQLCRGWVGLPCHTHHNEEDGKASLVELTCCASLLANSRVRFFNGSASSDK